MCIRSRRQQTYVAVTTEKVNNILGTTLTGADIADVFTRLGFAYKEEDGVFEVQPPLERLDITIAEDLVEEVVRIVGYDKVAAVPLPPSSIQPAINANFYAAEKVREELQAQGYSEVFTSVFTDKGERVVLNKVDGVHPYLRESLVPGLIEALNSNLPNKEFLGLPSIKLFEIGSVWKDGKEVTMIGTIEGTRREENMKSVAGKVPTERLLEPVESNHYDELPLSTATRYQSFSKYPYIVRDIALWTPAGTDADEVLEMIQAKAGELCVKIYLFDTFTKEGRVSLAFRLIFQSFERTLTEEEVNKIMAELSGILGDKGFEIR